MTYSTYFSFYNISKYNLGAVSTIVKCGKYFIALFDHTVQLLIHKGTMHRVVYHPDTRDLDKARRDTNRKLGLYITHRVIFFGLNCHQKKGGGTFKTKNHRFTVACVLLGHVSEITKKQQSNILNYHMAHRKITMKTILKSFNSHRDAYVNQYFSDREN